nr:putative retrotransposon Ty1-copia subclass protein [Tanacetum cinerariifolium]
MNEVYYYGQNSCYDSTSIGFDQSQPQQYTVDHPIFNAHNSYLDSQIQLNSTLAMIMDQMTSITSLCKMACQVAQKKLEEKQIEEERAAKAKYWKLPVCYDDDDDEEISDSLDDNIIYGLPPFSAIIPNEPVLSTEEPDNSLSMGDEHLDTITATESDEFIKSGVETLIPIPSESEGIPEHKCDVPSHENSPPLDVSTDQIEDLSESNKEFFSIDDDSFSIDTIDYVEASPPDSELVSSEVMEIVIPEVGGIDDDILLTIKDDILHPESGKWLNAMNVEIQSMKDNEVWVLVELPSNGKTIGNKWVFKKKTDMNGVVHTYKAHLVANGYTQTLGIDYEETFSPIVDIRAIKILIAIAAYYDYEIWQMDV